MTDKFAKLIDNVIDTNNTDNNIDKKTLKAYYILIYHDIECFFSGRKYEMIFDNKNIQREYKIDLYSFISLMNIQKDMLDIGIDLNYSLYVLNSNINQVFNEVYLDFVNASNIYKLNLDKEKNVQKLKEINICAKTLLLNYLNKK